MNASAAPAAQSGDGTLEGAPILCRRCGAPTEPRPDLSVVCRYCGSVDRLPPDALGRALEIRGRLAMAASRVAQLDGVEGALASIFEQRGAFLRVLGPWPLLAIGVVVYGIYSAVVELDALPRSASDAVRVEHLVGAAYGPLFVLGITLSFPAALLVGRLAYAKRIRPLLRARPPLWQGAPMRCRSCGADLPTVREAFATCRYCRTQNLMSDSSTMEHADRLAQEAAAYHARAAGAVAEAGRISTHMTRTLVIGFALVYLGVIGFGMLASVVVRGL